MLDLGTATATIKLSHGEFLRDAKEAGGALKELQSTANSGGGSGFINWVNANKAALTSWGKGLTIVGGAITSLFAAPLMMGTKAAWGQVDAVEQATVALRAYEKDASKVDAVLGGLLDYARSDSGVLFSRQELFGAAQSMKMYGAETENLVGYTEILSRSVGLGLTDWNSLNTVIGRVGSTGRLTGNDFDYLRAAGFDLDESLRNTNLTWEELFAALDKGIPADAMAGQADTIRGKMIRLQSALRNLGLDFLGVDKDTSKFIEGGLGHSMMRGLDQLRRLLNAAAPAARQLGTVVASVARVFGNLLEGFLKLPQPIQTAVIGFIGIAGVLATVSGGVLLMLPKIASLMTALGKLPAVFSAVSTAINVVRTAMVGLFANPAFLAAAVAIGAAILAYKTNFMGFADLVDKGVAKVKELWDVLQKVFGSPSSKTISIYDDWQADKYTIQATTLPDGTKVWNIVEDETGETFGQILESYTGEQGEAFILVQPEEGGPAFWAKADLETGKPEKIEIPIVAEDEPFQGTLTTITSATGNEVTVIINGDGEPIGTVLDEIITDPETGTKTVTIEMGDGTTFTASVDELKGTITPLEIEVTGDDRTISSFERKIRALKEALEEAWEWAARFGAQLDALMRSDWENFNWRETLDLLGLESMIGPIETLIGWFENLISTVGSAVEAVQGFFRQGSRATDDQNYATTQQRGNNAQGVGVTDRGDGVTSTPYARMRDSNDEYSIGDDGMALNPNWFRDQAIGANLGTQALNAYSESLRNVGSTAMYASPPLKQTDVDMNKMASTAGFIPGPMNAASGAVGAAGASMGGTFNVLAATAASRFGSLAASVSSNTAAANANATSNTSAMSSAVGGHFLGMQTRAAVQMALMASTASTQGNATSSNLTGALAGAVVRTSATLGQIPGIVSSVGGRAAGNAYAAGANIGGSFASGMQAYLGVIRAAAAAMVAAADEAVRARARIASPSKLFKQLGAYLGEGMEQGILGTLPDVARASDRLIMASTPSIPEYGYVPARYGGGTTVIDKSTHTTEYVALNDQQFHELLKAKDRANAMHNQLTRPDGISQYRKVAR